MTMAFTGYLLPFDQRSYWASIVGININGTGPIVGPYLSDFLRAGPELGATTLSRFYAIHMLLVPGAIIALIGAHLYLVVKLGTTAPPWTKIGNTPRVAEPTTLLDAGVSENGYHPNGTGATVAGVQIDGHGPNGGGAAA
jgi:quinol-cytochrome oxidoreductase complex cytochrome b subunit